MSLDADPPLLERFRAGITARMGLTFDDSRETNLAAILKQRAQAHKLSPERYVTELAKFDGELPELARLLTVPETYFFRNQAQLEAFIDGAVPACLERRQAPGLRILSAACASGEEPYSLAIMLRERRPQCAATASILGIDINPAVLERARAGRYTAWSLRETPAAWRARYFDAVGTEFALDSRIRDAVRFEAMNLVEPEPTQLAPSTYDIVFCRNALMYFTPEQFARTVGRLARALVPGGFLFLGHAETLRGVSQDFHLCHAGDAFYYQRKFGALRTSYPPPSASRVEPFRIEPLPDVEPQPPLDWYSTISHSTARVSALQRDSPLPAQSGAAGAATAASPHGQLLDLLEKEQFSQALAMLQQTRAPGDDADHTLMQAVVAAHAGRFDTARERCEQLLQFDELNAGAQYVLALCHEHAGELERAVYCDQLAAYLDPGFAMPRVHMGLLYRRLGDVQGVSRELREARRLIEREDASRLLLFGGGFGRAALLALCDAELAQNPREAR